MAKVNYLEKIMDKEFKKKIQQWKDILSGKITAINKEKIKKEKPIRIYQVAKELNVSYKYIIEFLNNNSINNQMAQINKEDYKLIIDRFNKVKSVFEKNIDNNLSNPEKSEIIIKEVIKKYQCALGKYQVKYIETKIEKK